MNPNHKNLIVNTILPKYQLTIDLLENYCKDKNISLVHLNGDFFSTELYLIDIILHQNQKSLTELIELT